MPQPSTTPTSARPHGWQRYNLRIVLNVVYLVLLVVCLLPVFGKSLLPDEWRATGALGGLLVGVAGNLLAHLIIQGLRDKPNPPPGRDAQIAARLRYLTNLRSPTVEVEQEQRENLQASNEVPRVLRGGAFWYDLRNVRCAYRNFGVARYFDDYIGFRVVVAGRP